MLRRPETETEKGERDPELVAQGSQCKSLHRAPPARAWSETRWTPLCGDTGDRAATDPLPWGRLGCSYSPQSWESGQGLNGGPFLRSLRVLMGCGEPDNLGTKRAAARA